MSPDPSRAAAWSRRWPSALSAALRPLRFIRAQLTGEVAADVAALLDGPRRVGWRSIQYDAVRAW